MCTNFLIIVTNIVYFTDQNFIILLKIRHFLLKSDLKFMINFLSLPLYISRGIHKNVYKFSTHCD